MKIELDTKAYFKAINTPLPIKIYKQQCTLE